MVTQALRRRFILISAGLFFAVALTVVVIVIPVVKADTFPGATPRVAVYAFMFIAALNVLLGGCLMAAVRKGGERSEKALLVAVGVLGLLLAVPLLDAAVAYAGEGRGMQFASGFLSTCVVAELGAAVLALVGTFLHRELVGGDAA